MMVSSMTLKGKNGLLTTLWDDSSVTLHGVKDGGSVCSDVVIVKPLGY